MKDRIWVVLLVVAYIIIATTLMKDVCYGVIVLAIEVNRRLVPNMMRGRKRAWAILVWFGCAFGLAGVCSIADLLLFPHSPRAMFRASDATVTTMIFMMLGFWAFWWGQRNWENRQRVKVKL